MILTGTKVTSFQIFETWYGQDISLSFTTWGEAIKIIPTRCISSGKLIKPFTKAYKGTRRIPNQGYSSGFMPRKEYFWMLPEEFTYNKLKGII